MKTLTTWDTMIHVHRDHPAVRGRGRCQVDAIVATRSKRAAAEAFGLSLYSLNLYASESGNAEAIEVATSEPGVVFVRGHFSDPWVRKDEKSSTY